MRSYILTFDYELFGSGKGDVQGNLIDPTYKILKMLDGLGVKATFFVEQLEIDAIIALKDHYPRLSKEYCQAIELEKQLEYIILNGHDIQLHLHPQWYGASYDNGKWKLNFDRWRFSSLPYRTTEDGVPGRYDLIKAGKESLEKRLRKFSPTYSCHSFRAGGYNVGLDRETTDALLENGMKLDSSICPGFFSNTNLSRYDYTGIGTDFSFWRSSEGFSRRESIGCLQLPLITIKSSFLEKLSFARVLAALKNRRLKSIDYYSGKKPEVKLSNPRGVRDSNFDVCLSSWVQVKNFLYLVGSNYDKNFMKSPVVLIGHPKDYSFFSPIKNVVSKLYLDGEFITVDEFLKRLS